MGRQYLLHGHLLDTVALSNGQDNMPGELSSPHHPLIQGGPPLSIQNDASLLNLRNMLSIRTYGISVFF